MTAVDPPPSLLLTTEQIAEYEELVEDVLGEYIHDYENFIAHNPNHDEQKLNKFGWEHAGSKDGLHCYKEKRSTRRNTSFSIDKSYNESSQSNTFSSLQHNTGGRLDGSKTDFMQLQPRGQVQLLRRPGNTFDAVPAKHYPPTFLTVGNIRGSMYDAMYGAFIHSSASMVLRTSYTKDHLDQAKVLAQFQSADKEDPFRFCGIVWVLHGKTIPFVQQRDAVFLCAMGLTRTSTGELIGYNLHHSIDLPITSHQKGKINRVLTSKANVVRAQCSVVMIRRQIDPEHFQFYQYGFYSPMGNLPEIAFMRMIVKTVLNTGSNVTIGALSKKLAILMESTSRRRTNSTHSNKSTATDLCACRSVTGRGSANDKGICMICLSFVCRRCKCAKDITLEATPDSVIQKSICFCIGCIQRADQLSSYDIAVQEAITGKRYAVRD